MREVSSQSEEISCDVRNLLYDREISEKVSKQKRILSSIKTLSEKLQQESATLGQGLHEWLTLMETVHFEYDQQKEVERKIFTKAAILSYILDPRLKGVKLSVKMLADAKLSMMMLLNDKNEYKYFIDYLKENDIFDQECLKNQESDVVWSTVEDLSPKLSSLALIFSHFPVSVFNQPKKKIENSLKFDEKYEFIQNML
jgi:hypothetical protein